MRIIAGKGKGKRLKTVSGLQVRPTTDRVKESVFQVIGPYFDGGWALDLFAGSGSLGVEALSRGVDRVVFIDQSGSSVRTIHENLRETGFESQAEVYRRDARAALRSLSKRELVFQYIFLDPPYREPILAEVLQRIGESGLLEPSGTVVAEHAADTPLLSSYGNLNNVRSLEFGDTVVDLYRLGNHGDGEV
ncbi:16S rRNA (guanine(966)-N(2))-methyltransferase RsmD [Desmospora activa]|uniref:16S rRNA (Guanine(966)-N(2))-methyltransferase RsmD n=1 Tax=Desmospora activa DSM 45169 TaxID=1121389 RepID=A0A2T4ZB41_9BACL|nr:16S rRNA (guanine(966)-N(2))-methyltransferase RsmD [Desmospora activa]PTM59113.1 16S rRNA (guanine(966)-N(2))-methyltransferase RsmD [Desmospora activa DSM 45169]